MIMEAGVVRKGSLQDLPNIIALEQKCFETEIAYTPQQLKYLLTKAHGNCIIETIEQTLRGFIIVLYKNKTRVAGVETLNVDPSFQGLGIGRKLLQAAEEDMFPRDIQKVRLEVSVGNQGAIRLYERAGFQIVAFLPNFYRYLHHRTYDAFRMAKMLPT